MGSYQIQPYIARSRIRSMSAKFNCLHCLYRSIKKVCLNHERTDESSLVRTDVRTCFSYPFVLVKIAKNADIRKCFCLKSYFCKKNGSFFQI